MNHPGVADSATVPVNHLKASQVPYCFDVPSNKSTVTESMLKQTLHGEYNLIVCILKFNLWRKNTMSHGIFLTLCEIMLISQG